MNTFKILIVDDHEIVRHGLRALLQDHEGWEVSGEAIDGRDAVAKVELIKPDLVILDIEMPNLNGLDAAREILRQDPNMKILVLTIHDSEQLIREVLNVGAKGFLLKSDAARDLIAAVEAVQDNRTFFTPKVAEVVLEVYLRGVNSSSTPKPLHERLTPRELQVVELLAAGKTTKEVAATLSMSVKTAETHRSNIMHKLSLHSATQLVLYAVRNNIVQISPAGNIPDSPKYGT